MPQATVQGSVAFGIRLNGGRFAYKPGDLISGWVVRSHYIFSNDAVVTITLAGRVKTRVIVNRFKTRLLPSALTYRGRTALVDEQQHTQIVFRGPLYIPPDNVVECAWPFAITIPNTYTEAEDAPPQNLPGTFTIPNGTGLYSWDEAYVEYTLRAELRAAGEWAPLTSVLPVTIMAMSPDPPVTDIPLLPRRLVDVVCSYRLHPMIGPSAPSGPEGTPEIVALVGRSPPMHAGNVQIDTPTMIQLEHPEPVSLRLSYFPLRHLIAYDGDGKPYKLQLLSLTMEITSTTEIDCDGPPNPRSLKSPASVLVVAWPAAGLSAEAAPPLLIPYGDDEPPIDVGKVAGLRIGYGGAMNEAFAQGDVRPSFSTRYVKSTHSITYKMKTAVCEEEMNYSCVMDVTILPPAMLEAPPVAAAATVEDEVPQPPSVPRRRASIPRPRAMHRRPLCSIDLPVIATIRSPKTIHDIHHK